MMKTRWTNLDQIQNDICQNIMFSYFRRNNIIRFQVIYVYIDNQNTKIRYEHTSSNENTQGHIDENSDVSTKILKSKRLFYHQILYRCQILAENLLNLHRFYTRAKGPSFKFKILCQEISYPSSSGVKKSKKESSARG